MTDSEHDSQPVSDDVPLTGNLWVLRQLFRRVHDQIDATIEMLPDDENEPAPSVPAP